MKPLFIPLKTEFFEAFREKRKTHEYRAHGPRWNGRTCVVGRKVILSKGYGKAQRITGTIVSFTVWPTAPDEIREAWMRCYGNRATKVADIEVLLT